MANTFNLGNGNWATKEEALLAYNAENDNFKPLPFDFDRGSTATRVNKDGLIETVGVDEPRIDFLNNTKGHLLLEPSRTNLITDSAEGNYGNAPASESNTIAPDGTNTAVIPVPDSNSDRYNYSFSGGDYSTNTKLTYSWFRKRISTPTSTAFLGDLRPTNLVNVTQVGSTIQIGSNINGYDRFSATFNVTDGSLSGIIRMYFGSVIGIGNSSIAYWGHQAEEGSYATSYIPTSGSTATRSAETCNNAGNSNVFNDSEGVLYWECSSLYNDLTNRIISVSQGNQNNTVQLYFDASSNRIRGTVRAVDGTYQCVLNYTVSDTTDYIKAAIKYKANDFALWVNGVERATDTSGNAPTGLSEISFDSGSGSLDFYGKVKDIRVYNIALSDSELQALTS
jgi:hypothetical protein